MSKKDVMIYILITLWRKSSRGNPLPLGFTVVADHPKMREMPIYSNVVAV
jgi:hypothetical protein